MPVNLPRRITQRTLVRVLIAGFGLVILLLVVASAITVHNTRSIHAQAEELVAEQALIARLINEIQSEQAAINAIFYQLTRDPESIDRDQMLAQLDAANAGLSRIVKLSADTPEAKLWTQWEAASREFSNEAKRLIGADTVDEDSLRLLVRRHDEVRVLVRDLVLASSARAASAEGRITVESDELLKQSGLLLGMSVLLAFFCAVLTVRLTLGVFRRMEWQTGELSRVSWHMLQSQEQAARRFSHELHDELGQSLSALKANVSALNTENMAARRRDCITLVDEAIGNVRELSQLLRPVILDDFGLDAGLRWLGEKFSQRTGIEVKYTSEFSDRLADETETHLFRIAQEALTNVARHSGATRVDMHMRPEGDRIVLTIRDNGQGIKPAAASSRKTSLGMVGMRARARDAGGELTVESAKGAGVTITASVPARAKTESIDAEQENTYSAG